MFRRRTDMHSGRHSKSLGEQGVNLILRAVFSAKCGALSKTSRAALGSKEIKQTYAGSDSLSDLPADRSASRLFTRVVEVGRDFFRFHACLIPNPHPLRQEIPQCLCASASRVCEGVTLC